MKKNVTSKKLFIKKERIALLNKESQAVIAGGNSAGIGVNNANIINTPITLSILIPPICPGGMS